MALDSPKDISICNSGNDNDITAVYWPAGDNSWKSFDTGNGITRYKLFQTPQDSVPVEGLMGQMTNAFASEYPLYITNVSGWGFTFFDEAGDSYSECRLESVFGSTEFEEQYI